ncbi:MAG: hypothetical protein IJ911_09210 [Salinivirgaceae bacterium]|nr:hypothetical protein [Salinivirgaceae bacterium]
MSLSDTIFDFLATVTDNGNTAKKTSSFAQAITSLYLGNPVPDIFHFSLDDKTTADAISSLKNILKINCHNNLKSLNPPLTYLFDELICNIQQHAQTDKGYAYLNYNESTQHIEIIVADCGITIYGSYVSMQKHLDKLGNSDADALNLAQKGYSVKNLPNTENRGYGISSNIKLVVNGLKGEFSVLSGNALMIHSSGKSIILSLPKEIDFKGTMIMATFPSEVPTDFDIYKYTS